MIRKTIYILLCFVLTHVQAQVSHSIQLGFAPEYHNWLYEPTINLKFEQNFGYAFHLNYKMTIKDRFYVISGLEYNHFLPRNKYASSSNIDEKRSNTGLSQTMLGLNLKLGFKFLKSTKFNIGVETGINFKYHIDLISYTNIYYTDTTPNFIFRDKFTNVLKSVGSPLVTNATAPLFLFEGQIGLPLSYQFSDHWSIYIQPYFAYTFNNTLVVEGLFSYKVNAYRIGAFIGTEFKF